MRKQYYKRGELAYRVLKAVAGGALITVAIILALSGTGFYRKKHYRKDDGAQEKERGERQRFYSTLSRLRKDGLLVKRGKSWEITEKGKKYISKMDEYSTIVHVKEYPKTRLKSGRIIIAFDIPEKLRSKRDALRATLALFGCTMLQKSLWISKYKIPEEFFDDLKEWKVAEYVHIFAVIKYGTIVG